MRRARRADESGNFLGTLFLHPEEHEEGAELLGQDLPGEDHRHRLLGFVDGQRTGQRLAAAEDGDETGEGVRLTHHDA